MNPFVKSGLIILVLVVGLRMAFNYQRYHYTHLELVTDANGNLIKKMK